MNRLVVTLLFLFLGCKHRVEIPMHKSGMLSLFIHIGYEHKFQLTVNDSLHYNACYPGATDDEGPQVLVDVIPKTGIYMKFELHIDDRDTTFLYGIKDVDSLRFGLFSNKRFMISNQSQMVWFFD